MNRTTARLFWALAALLVAGAASADTIDDIRERGTLRIGVAEFAPWTLKNRDGKLEGFEIDVGRRVAYDMRVQPDFRLYAWDEIIDGLERGEIDIIAAGMAISPERALRVEFSNPYTWSGTTLVTNTEVAPDAESIDDLNQEGKVVVTVAQTMSGIAAPA